MEYMATSSEFMLVVKLAAVQLLLKLLRLLPGVPAGDGDDDAWTLPVANPDEDWPPIFIGEETKTESDKFLEVP